MVDVLSQKAVNERRSNFCRCAIASKRLIILTDTLHSPSIYHFFHLQYHDDNYHHSSDDRFPAFR